MSRFKVLDFMLLIGKLKTTQRAGWVQRGVPNPESVSDHMYRMAAVALLADKHTGLDKNKCIKMALVHDMAECIVGDLTPQDGVSKTEKHLREKAAMNHIQSLLDSEVGNEMYQLWEEYESQTSEDAKFVKDLDMFDMIVQAYEYETMHDRPQQLSDFFHSTQGKFHTDLVRSWVDELNERRNQSTEKDQRILATEQSSNVD